MNLNEALEILKEHGFIIKLSHDNNNCTQYTDETWLKDAMYTRYTYDRIIETADRLEGAELIPLDDEFCIIQDEIVQNDRELNEVD